MRITKRTDVRLAMWLGLGELRWLLVAEGKTSETTTLGDIARVRAAQRRCIAPAAGELS